MALYTNPEYVIKKLSFHMAIPDYVARKRKLDNNLKKMQSVSMKPRPPVKLKPLNYTPVRSIAILKSSIEQMTLQNKELESPEQTIVEAKTETEKTPELPPVKENPRRWPRTEVMRKYMNKLYPNEPEKIMSAKPDISKMKHVVRDAFYTNIMLAKNLKYESGKCIDGDYGEITDKERETFETFLKMSDDEIVESMNRNKLFREMALDCLD